MLPRKAANARERLLAELTGAGSLLISVTPTALRGKRWVLCIHLDVRRGGVQISEPAFE
jgi:hypothetical protein